jgi:hypothetical protein
MTGTHRGNSLKRAEKARPAPAQAHPEDEPVVVILYGSRPWSWM